MAKGSHKTWAGWEPRVCHDCGRKLTLTGDSMHNLDDLTGEAWSICGDCLLARARRRAAGAVR